MNASVLPLRAFALAVAAVGMLIGCTRPPSAPLQAPYPTPRSLVVVPLANHSPSADLDNIAATDVLVAELAQVDGLVVLPTNRALKLLLGRGKTHATSLGEALEVAGELGADGVLVGAVTEHQPYKPQKLGLILQLYWIRSDSSTEGTDPIDYSRRARGDAETFYSGRGPTSQVQALFDASRDDVTELVYDYARNRKGTDSPLGWRRYLMDSEAFMHFACHEMVARLLDAERSRITTPAHLARVR